MMIIFCVFVAISISIHTVKSFEGIFWDVCDIHLNISFNDSLLWNNNQYLGDSPLFLIKSAFQHMKDVHPNPDFMIVNGDNFYHGDNEFVNSLQIVRQELFSYFPNTIFLPSLGNHDVDPRNIIGPDSKWCEKWFEIWNITNLNASQAEIDNFKKGCFYSRTIQSKSGPLLVMVLNTLLWYERNTPNANVFDPFGQFAWVEQKLKNARVEKTKVFLMGHVSPGSPEYSSNLIHNMFEHFNTKFLQIMQNYADVIDAAFFAHQHTDAFKIVYDTNDVPIIPVFQAPSVTPFFLWDMGRVNPSVRLYNWSDNSINRRYDQYHAVLSTENNHRQPNLTWILEYSSTQMLPAGLSAGNLNELVKDFSLDQSIHFDKFFEYHMSGQEHVNKTCPPRSECRYLFICAMTKIDYSALYRCLESRSKPNNLWLIIFLPILAVLILIALIGGVFFILRRKRGIHSANINDDL